MSADNAVAEPVLAIAAKIRQWYRPEEIILFGSYAYGEPDGSSDVDLLIVKRDARPRLDRQREVADLVREERGSLSVCPFVYTPEELEGRLALGDPFLQDIIQKGVVLYASGDYSSKRRLPMPYKKPEKAVILEWFGRGAEDLGEARGVRDRQGALRPGLALLQQATEKYLKAFLLFHGWRLERTHDLVELLEEAIKHDQGFSRFLPMGKRLTDLFLPARYPSETPFDLSREEFESHLKTVEEMTDRIKKAIGYADFVEQCTKTDTQPRR